MDVIKWIIRLKKTELSLVMINNPSWARKVTGVPDRVVVERVFVHPDYRGQGIAAELVRQFVKYATTHQLTVKLMCPYAVKQFQIHPEYQQLLLPEDRF